MRAACVMSSAPATAAPRGDVGARELAGLGEITDQVDAALAVALGIGQGVARVGGHVLALHCARQQRVALDLGVVFEHELRVFGVEGGPVALLAEHQQPVVAQAVGDGLALVALQERADLVFRRICARVAAGVEQLRLDAEILDVGWDRVVGQAVRELPAAGHVVAARGVAQLDEGIVRIGRNDLQRRPLAGHRQGHRPHRAHADHARESQRHRAIYCLALHCHFLPHHRYGALIIPCHPSATRTIRPTRPHRSNRAAPCAPCCCTRAPRCRTGSRTTARWPATWAGCCMPCPSGAWRPTGPRRASSTRSACWVTGWRPTRRAARCCPW